MSKIRRALLALALPPALLATLLGAAAQAQPATSTTINVTLGDNRYDPDVIELHVGQPYILHLTNATPEKRGFEAKAFFDTVVFAEWSKGRVKKGDVEVWGKMWNDIAFTPQTPGDYDVHSPDPMNQLLGMKGHIVVH